MTDFEKEEFWKGLARLYETSVQQTKEIAEVKESLTALRGRVAELHVVVTDLSGVVKQLADVARKQSDVAQSHERRLDRTEVTVEAILEDLRRHREGRA
jgi:hypothetical protein